jgi:hypothetical protein
LPTSLANEPTEPLETPVKTLPGAGASALAGAVAAITRTRRGAIARADAVRGAPKDGSHGNAYASAAPAAPKATATASTDTAVIAGRLTAAAIGWATLPAHPHNEVLDEPPMGAAAAARVAGRLMDAVAAAGPDRVTSRLERQRLPRRSTN